MPDVDGQRIESVRFGFLVGWDQLPGERTPELNAALDERDRLVVDYLTELDRRITALEA